MFKKKVLVICPSCKQYSKLISDIKKTIKVFTKISEKEFKKFRFIFKSFSCERETVSKELSLLLSSHNFFSIISPLFSQHSLGLPVITERYKVPTFHLWASDPTITKNFRYSFRIIYSDYDQAKAAAIFTRKELLKYRGIMIVDNEYRYSSIITQIFRKIFEETGGELYTVLKIKNQEGWIITLEKLFEKNPQFVYSPSHPETNRMLYKILKETGFEGDIIFNDWTYFSGKKKLGEFEGVYFTLPYIQNLEPTEKGVEFLKEYTRMFSEPPSETVYLTYDALVVLKSILNFNDKNKIPELLRNREYEGMFWKFTFKKSGAPVRPVLVVRRKDGKIEYVGRVVV